MQQHTNNIIEPKRYKRIVAYGCSYTAGDEIADHLILNTTFKECNVLKKQYKEQWLFYHAYNLYEESAKKLMGNLSWAGQLANLCNLPFENRSQPGSSLDHIYVKIYSDYINNFIDRNDLILVGITSPGRISFWNKHTLDSMTIVNYIEHYKKLDKQSQMAISELFDDNIILLNYFLNLQNLSNLKNILDIRLQVMLTHNTPGHKNFMYSINNEINGIIIDMCKKIDNILVREVGLDNHFAHTIGFCGYGHPPLESHTYLAQLIYKMRVINTEAL